MASAEAKKKSRQLSEILFLVKLKHKERKTTF
jgi:hypothetical protein